MGYPGIDTERPEPDRRPTEVNFVLLGRTGAGKSASGNTILGKKVFESKFGAKSKTNECREATALVSGRRLTVLDTPGLYDTRHGMEKFESEMPKVKEFSRKGQCILLLVIELGRFTEEEENSIRDILKSFPREPLSKFMILFTNGDKLEGQPIEEFLGDADDNLQRVLHKFGNRYHVFNNKSDPHDGQVLQLLEKADDMLMEDQQSIEFPIPNLDVMIEDFFHFQSREEEDDETTPEPLRLVLLGKAGTGKSASGNTILGRDEFISKSGTSSVTTESQRQEGVVFGRKVDVVDTPGFFGNSGCKEKIAEEVVKSIFLSAPGPHAFLLVISLNERLTTEAKDTIKELHSEFGEDFKKYTIILFSHLDMLGQEETVEDVIKSNPELNELLRPFENRIHAFDNKRSNRDQVRKLFEMIDELVKENGGGCYTDEKHKMAEEAMRRKADRLFQEHEEEIRRRIEERLPEVNGYRAGQDENRAGQDGNRGGQVRHRGIRVQKGTKRDGNTPGQSGNTPGQSGGNSLWDQIKLYFVNAFRNMITFGSLIEEILSLFRSHSGRSTSGVYEHLL